jgi:filamentous hemagglutinin family protein
MARPSNKGLISCFFALIRELTGVAILSLTLTFFIGPVHTFAQVATIITESGLDTSIEHTAGSTTWNIRGGRPSSGNTNLFHSFGDLSVGTGDTAVFQNLQADGTTPVVTNAGGVNNIIGRVTGGNPSNIFGTINSQTGFPNANLFLINPPQGMRLLNVYPGHTFS